MYLEKLRPHIAVGNSKVCLLAAGYLFIRCKLRYESRCKVIQEGVVSYFPAEKEGVLAALSSQRNQ